MKSGVRNGAMVLWCIVFIALFLIFTSEAIVDLDKRLNAIFRKQIAFDDREMEKNKRIAVNFVDGFRKYLAKDGDPSLLSVTVTRQGSAFEGVKVGAPDEFDFLLILDYSAYYDVIKQVEGRTLGLPGPEWVPKRGRLSGYWQFRLKQIDRPVLGTFSGLLRGHNNYMSPDKFKRFFQTKINGYTKEVRSGRSVQEIRIDQPIYASIGDPALTVVLTKSGGKKISVDMTVCLKIRGRRYIGKRHPILKENCSNKDVFESLWLHTCSEKELDQISAMPENIKKNYRITKYLLREKILKNSYIVKTAFLQLYKTKRDNMPSSPTQFLRDILEYLAAALKERSLLARFNPEENILSRYREEEIDSYIGYFNRLVRKDMESIVDSLMPREQARAREQIYTASQQCSETETEHEDGSCAVS